MKPEQHIQQEILLFTTTRFSQRQWCALDAGEKTASRPSPTDELEKACWNGLLYELLPEIMPATVVGRNVFLWQINRGHTFLCLELGKQPLQTEPACSINPYVFLQSRKEQ